MDNGKGKQTWSAKAGGWIVGVSGAALIGLSTLIWNVTTDAYKEVSTTLTSINQSVHTNMTSISLINQKLRIIESGEQSLSKEERDYWAWFRRTHNGVPLGPAIQGGSLALQWDIPVRPVAAMEIQIAVILDEEGIGYKGTTAPFITVPEEADKHGRTKNRYRHDAQDRRISHFRSTEGVPLPNYLKPGFYMMNYQYVFLDSEGNVQRIATDQLIPFEIVEKDNPRAFTPASLSHSRQVPKDAPPPNKAQ